MFNRFKVTFFAGLASFIVVGNALATPISQSRVASNVDFCSAGVAGTSGSAAGTITLNCVVGTVSQAFLYWHGIGNPAYDNANVTLNGNAVTGTSLGDATTNCWGSGSSRGFEADVTSIVTGNGAYDLAGLSSASGNSSNGAALIVLFDDGTPANNRDVVFFTGNDSNIPQGFPGEDQGWHASLPGINYGGGVVGAQIQVADGQNAGDGTLVFSTVNGSTTITDTTSLYDGNSVPSEGTGRGGHGLWDIHDFDITGAFGGVPGMITLDVDGLNSSNDCLALTALLLDLGPGSAPNAIDLEPDTAVNCTDEQHTVTATVKDGDGNPQDGQTVEIDVISGPNAGVSGLGTTDANGEFSLTYAGTTAGTDTIRGCTTNDDGTSCVSVTKEWEVCGEPTARCDVDANGGVDIFDIRAIMGRRNQPASGPDDPADADGNGIINANDARQCVLQCDNSRCAPTP